MSQLNFGIKIAAKDTTRGTLRSALSGFTGFAKAVSKPIVIPLKIGRKGLALARDARIVLGPLIAGLDNVIERGSGLEVVKKSFASLTGQSGRQLDQLARRLVQAASGTITLAKAMQVANRALGSGLSFEQLAVAIEFIGKKSITTGKNAQQAIDTVITGLSRGSTLFLDDFGILVDGIDGVKAAFDKIKGTGAFDSLAPAAQKAEKVRQAISEMREQLGKIGVTGNEVIFVFQGIKNEIANIADGLVLSITKSAELKAVLETVRNVAGGISKHFQEGGGILGVLLGKKKPGGGRGTGLLGILKAGVLDLGEALDRGFLGAGLTFLAKMTNVFADVIDILPGKIKKGFEFLETEFLPKLKKALKEFAENFLANAIKGLLVDAKGKPTTLGDAVGVGDPSNVSITRSILRKVVRSFVKMLGVDPDKVQPLTPPPGKAGLNQNLFGPLPVSSTAGFGARPELFFRGAVGAAVLGAGGLDVFGRLREVPRGLVDAFDRFGRKLSGGSTKTTDALRDLAKNFELLGDRIRNGGKGGRLKRALDEFNKDFAPPKKKKKAEGGEPLEHPLNRRGRQKVERENARIRNRIRIIEGGGGFARQKALRLTAERLREAQKRAAALRRQGFDVPPPDRTKIFRDAFKEVVEELTRALREKLKKNEETLRRSGAAEQRDFGQRIGDPIDPRFDPTKPKKVRPFKVKVGRRGDFRDFTADGQAGAKGGDGSEAKVVAEKVAAKMDELNAGFARVEDALGTVATALVGSGTRIRGAVA